MLTKLRQRMAREESGFTLVELLVVMLIIGLLAAIAIPSFFNQRDKAKDADAKSFVRTAQTAMETWSTDNNGLYTGGTPAKLIQIEETLNDVPSGVAGDFTTSAGPDSYTVKVKSKTGNTFWITRNAGGTVAYLCDTDGKGGCPSDGTWGS